MKADPFLISGPAVVSFSGGRTSAYMLWRVLRAHGGTLPPGVVVCFANTGREMEGTLEFVRDCGERWDVPVRWLEYRRDPLTGRVWAAEVSFETASRHGEPFEMAIAAKQMLPNPVTRYCTAELKIRTIRRWCVQQFGKGIIWTQVVGLRADEPRRVERIMDPARLKKNSAEARNVVVPLAAAGVTKADVLGFWSRQNFDLRLGGEWEGNCDGYFLKRRAAIARMFRDHPDRMEWWPRMEATSAHKVTINPAVALFRKDRPSYAAIRDTEFDQGRLALAPDDDGWDVFAACEGGCGV